MIKEEKHPHSLKDAFLENLLYQSQIMTYIQLFNTFFAPSMPDYKVYSLFQKT
jgi:hypothetical protein